MEILTKSEKETQKFAKDFAKSLKSGDILALGGDLGSGKTAFTKGIASALGISDIVTSPTFVILKNYEIKNKKPASPAGGSKIKNLIHIDCYRLTDIEDAKSIGLQEYFELPDNIIVIEWAENIKFILPNRTKYIGFENLGKDKRKIVFK